MIYLGLYSFDFHVAPVPAPLDTDLVTVLNIIELLHFIFNGQTYVKEDVFFKCVVGKKTEFGVMYYSIMEENYCV